MMRYTLTITDFASDAARAQAARIIASSQGFYYSEEEAFAILDADPPVTISFEAERTAGERTLDSIRAAGCELSYTQQETELTQPSESQARFSRRRLTEDFSEEQLEALERRVNRMPWVLLALCILSFLVGWTAVRVGAFPSVLGAMFLIVFMAAGAYAAHSQEAWGHLTCLVFTGLAGLVSGALAFFTLLDSLGGAAFHRVAMIGPIAILPIAIPSALAVVCAFSVHIFLTLLKKPVREWFSSF